MSILIEVFHGLATTTSFNISYTSLLINHTLILHHINQATESSKK
jgi:hypothetical protein